MDGGLLALEAGDLVLEGGGDGRVRRLLQRRELDVELVLNVLIDGSDDLGIGLLRSNVVAETLARIVRAVVVVVVDVGNNDATDVVAETVIAP